MKSASRAATYRRVLTETAFGAAGVVTAEQAQALGVPTAELEKLTGRGFLRQTRPGVYRVVDVPEDLAGRYVEAVRWGGTDAYLTGPAVLALLGLADPPADVRIAGPHRVRLEFPAWLSYERRSLADHELALYDEVRSTTLARALVDSRGLVGEDRLADAVTRGLQRSLLTANEADDVLVALSRPLAEPLPSD